MGNADVVGGKGSVHRGSDVEDGSDGPVTTGVDVETHSGVQSQSKEFLELGLVGVGKTDVVAWDPVALGIFDEVGVEEPAGLGGRRQNTINEELDVAPLLAWSGDESLVQLLPARHCLAHDCWEISASKDTKVVEDASSQFIGRLEAGPGCVWRLECVQEAGDTLAA